MSRRFQAVRYAVLTAAVTLASAWGVSLLVGDRAEETTLQIVQRIEQNSERTRELICDILANAESEGVRDAVGRHCP